MRDADASVPPSRQKPARKTLTIAPDSPMLDLGDEMEEWPFRMGGGGGGGPAGVREEEEEEMEEEEGGGGGFPPRLWESEVAELWMR